MSALFASPRPLNVCATVPPSGPSSPSVSGNSLGPYIREVLADPGLEPRNRRALNLDHLPVMHEVALRLAAAALGRGRPPFELRQGHLQFQQLDLERVVAGVDFRLRQREMRRVRILALEQLPLHDLRDRGLLLIEHPVEPLIACALRDEAEHLDRVAHVAL